MYSEGWISHAILDVFEKEPLPTDSELWARQDVTITPHISGGFFDHDQVLLAIFVFNRTYAVTNPFNNTYELE